MRVNVLREAGYIESLLGISLSRDQPLDNMPKVAYTLSNKQGGHNKFLESIIIWIDVTAPRYWFQQMDTYRVGVSKMSGSTMYTIMKRELVQDDFESSISSVILDELNRLILAKDFEKVKNSLPEGFLQRRIICTNYKSFQNMYIQRIHHKLPQWQFFLNAVLSGINHPELIVRDYEKRC
jgi:hypothetical protein